ncbi:DUF4198 domain-containing protein [Roseobacter sp. HKCCD9010]|uniref:DUF4198 domain-containing protein n=1 Tax=unclassified Roseobacter TaxID=196798 RepID=UPI001490EC29|nr:MULTISPECIES: DUF4198 domain-containing protein [unclassified Roseobacter]MBF9050955.1 DUF4198 domain-containing protein [Rhodobacterales bacterium HKCCD4356]NNV12724.1 DUF4198 domain-containing protein [Roseobacter sp. HKCCD7357]NNV16668.1 DUF4198 domain-containing protein [Roseobacter sp. HKCCD8768]NNV26700.1 DUF4198 domain-containing protein [Roseobacter sp. HKCCD8192]NNV30387.1 DUF4198 domain-containing protein [Roseobacter sp. HKCCD9061]
MRHLLLALTLALTLGVSKTQAHEFWIEPEGFQIAPDDNITAYLRVGQEFSGVTISYLPRNFTRFDVMQGDILTNVEGRLGDNPALDMGGFNDGLAIIVHETTANRLTYDEWDSFLRFAAHKDFGDVEARHDARGLPREGFRESYIRYAKSLVAIGDGAGQDRQVGLATEIVALANPYTDDVSAGLPVQVLLDGAPRVNAQVELFDRAPDGTVEITLHHTDEAGIAVLPVTAGHEYLADAVVLEPLDAPTPSDPVWLSRWASLTFSVP